MLTGRLLQHTSMCISIKPSLHTKFVWSFTTFALHGLWSALAASRGVAGVLMLLLRLMLKRCVMQRALTVRASADVQSAQQALHAASVGRSGRRLERLRRVLLRLCVG